MKQRDVKKDQIELERKVVKKEILSTRERAALQELQVDILLLFHLQDLDSKSLYLIVKTSLFFGEVDQSKTSTQRCKNIDIQPIAIANEGHSVNKSKEIKTKLTKLLSDS